MLNSSLEFVDKKTRTQRNLRSLLDEVPAKEEKVDEPTVEVKGFMTPEEEVQEEPTVNKVVDMSEYAANEENAVDEVVEETPVETTKVTEEVVEPPAEETPVEEENTFEIPTISDEELKPQVPVNEKLRVVEIIPINDTITEKEEEKDFMVNDFQDDDYVDFESAISEVGEN